MQFQTRTASNFRTVPAARLNVIAGGHHQCPTDDYRQTRIGHRPARRERPIHLKRVLSVPASTCYP